jgi:hypothetical protein
MLLNNWHAPMRNFRPFSFDCSAGDAWLHALLWGHVALAHSVEQYACVKHAIILLKECSESLFWEARWPAGVDWRDIILYALRHTRVRRRDFVYPHDPEAYLQMAITGCVVDLPGNRSFSTGTALAIFEHFRPSRAAAQRAMVCACRNKNAFMLAWIGERYGIAHANDGHAIEHCPLMPQPGESPEFVPF